MALRSTIYGNSRIDRFLIKFHVYLSITVVFTVNLASNFLFSTNKATIFLQILSEFNLQEFSMS
jgi:hypothetical protein